MKHKTQNNKIRKERGSVLHAPCLVLHDNRGFSIIEMLVATALFSVVMMIGVGSLLSLVDANRKAQSLKSTINNLNFAIESMSRNIRTGTRYRCGPNSSSFSFGNIEKPADCTTGGKALAFEIFGGSGSSPPDQVVYRFIRDNPGDPGRLERCTQTCYGAGAIFLSITAPEVNIEEFNFYVFDSRPRPGNSGQPRVLMTIRGSTGSKIRTRTTFNLQTMVTQRVLDL